MTTFGNVSVLPEVRFVSKIYGAFSNCPQFSETYENDNYKVNAYCVHQLQECGSNHLCEILEYKRVFIYKVLKVKFKLLFCLVQEIH